MNSSVTKNAALAGVGVVAASLLLAGCGSSAPAAGDNADLQSNSTANSSSSSSAGANGTNGSAGADENVSNELKFPDAKADTGTYGDGTYTVSGQYGEHSASTLDVSVTVGAGKVTSVEVKPTTSSAISKKYGDDFVKAVSGEVVGKDLKDLKLSVVAGASWTTDAFNQALVNVRGEASVQASVQAGAQ
ncbi:hypothetical protein B9G54_03895 [Alloscardovia macacae]|uniref:FMN-binding protein n=1 Tax=Alloscardovia macacae TaxID=1160091 RepID=A0A1Y2T119_9BIFI|nr:hypothetical protein [Alloscardovia macacae]OTA26728.1 hypothetical protein B9G54_03895 [Alloscardovia macacae]OTA29594.1 hypothetical protein B9T39_03045 [Alloscardovia macacae]